MSCLGERTREKISAYSLVMTCVVEQGQLLSTLDASGSVTGAHDPEHSVWKNGWGKQLHRQLSHTARHGLNHTQPKILVSAGCARTPLPPPVGPGPGAPGFSPTLSQTSAQLSRRPVQFLRAVAAYICFISAISELCDTG